MREECEAWKKKNMSGKSVIVLKLELREEEMKEEDLSRTEDVCGGRRRGGVCRCVFVFCPGLRQRHPVSLALPCISVTR